MNLNLEEAAKEPGVSGTQPGEWKKRSVIIGVVVLVVAGLSAGVAGIAVPNSKAIRQDNAESKVFNNTSANASASPSLLETSSPTVSSTLTPTVSPTLTPTIVPATFFPKVGTVLRGYDLINANPKDTASVLDPGLRGLIFAASWNQKSRTPDRRHAIPDGLLAMPCNGTCSVSFRSQRIRTLNDYTSSLSSKSNVKASAKFGDLFAARFSASENFKGAQSTVARRVSEIFIQRPPAVPTLQKCTHSTCLLSIQHF